MKQSFICEDVSIEKAIEKAIKMADNPEIFIVKILDHGTQSLLWWKRKNIKIAFSYAFEDNYFDFLSNYEEEKKKLQNINAKKNNANNSYLNNNNNINNNNINNNNINSNINNNNKINNLHKKNNINASEKEEFKKLLNNEKLFNKKQSSFQNKNIIENDSKSIIEKKDLKNNLIDDYSEDYDIEKRIEKKLIDFTHEEINFIRSWINDVCINFNISSDVPVINIDKSVLIINVVNIKNNVINVRHLSAGLVILLNETLKSNFKGFNPRNYKIMINCI